MMQGTYKTFEPSEHKEFDEKAKRAAIKILEANGYKAYPNGIYDIDLSVYDLQGKEEVFKGDCEVVVIKKWIDGCYPYEKVKLVERKINQLRQWKKRNSCIMILNVDCTRAIFAKFSDIEQFCDNLEAHPNSKIGDGSEKAAFIPADKFRLLELKQ